MPALTGTRGNLSSAIRQTGWGRSGFRHWRLANTLVGVQVALSLVLLVAAGLFLRSLQHAASIDVGLKGEGALMMAVDPKGQGFSPEETKRFFLALQQRVEALPGVQSMGYIDLPPLSLAVNNAEFSDPDRPAGKHIPGDVMRVGAHYFAASGMSLVSGRDFGVRDDKAGVAVVNQAMAERLFGAENPIGRSVREGDDPAGKSVYQVIGLVRNAKVETLGEGEVACMFRYLSDFDGGLATYGVTIMVRAVGGDPRRLARAVQREVTALDRDLPLFNVETLEDHIDDALLLPRVSGALFGAFGSIGLVLAVVGLYGVVSYSVRTRTQEFGIRMALGASPSRVAGMLVGQGLLVVGAGLAAGLLAAFALSRFTASLLYGIAPTDPVTFLGVPAVLIAAFLAAILLPARRVSRIEPMTALRNE